MSRVRDVLCSVFLLLGCASTHAAPDPGGDAAIDEPSPTLPQCLEQACVPGQIVACWLSEIEAVMSQGPAISEANTGFYFASRGARDGDVQTVDVTKIDTAGARELIANLPGRISGIELFGVRGEPVLVERQPDRVQFTAVGSPPFDSWEVEHAARSVIVVEPDEAYLLTEGDTPREQWLEHWVDRGRTLRERFVIDPGGPTRGPVRVHPRMDGPPLVTALGDERRSLWWGDAGGELQAPSMSQCDHRVGAYEVLERQDGSLLWARACFEPTAEPRTVELWHHEEAAPRTVLNVAGQIKSIAMAEMDDGRIVLALAGSGHVEFRVLDSRLVEVAMGLLSRGWPPLSLQMTRLGLADVFALRAHVEIPDGSAERLALVRICPAGIL